MTRYEIFDHPHHEREFEIQPPGFADPIYVEVRNGHEARKLREFLELHA